MYSREAQQDRIFLPGPASWDTAGAFCALSPPSFSRPGGGGGGGAGKLDIYKEQNTND